MSAPESTPEPTRRERELAQHRQDILDAATHLFAENGYHETTMQMVADRAEFSVGYLYKHFPGKDEMYRELVRFHSGRMAELIAEAAAQPLPPLARFRYSLEMVVRHFNRHPDFMRIYHEDIGGECGGLGETKKNHTVDLIQTLREAQDAGELRPYDPVLLAAAIQGTIKEMFHELALRTGENPFDGLPDMVFQLIIDPLRK